MFSMRPSGVIPVSNSTRVVRPSFVTSTRQEKPCSARSTSPAAASANGARRAGPASASSASVTLSTSVVTAMPSTGWSGTVSIALRSESRPLPPVLAVPTLLCDHPIVGRPTILGTERMSTPATRTAEARERSFTTLCGEEIAPLYGPEDVGAVRGADRGARRVPLHARDLPEHVPRAAVDDAPVRRLRHGGGDQRALPLPARPRPDRAEHRVRHAQPDGPRLRRAALARRGRPRGRRDRHARRHGDAVRRASTSATSPCR